ncbi:MAG: peptidylprolyl isomerase [Pseudomonadota bacterium]
MALASPLKLTAALLIASAPLAFAQTSEETAEAPADAATYSADTVLARIGETEVTLGHITLMVSLLPEQYQQLPDDTLMQGIIEQLIDQTVLADAAGSEADWSEELALRVENERRAVLARAVIDATAEMEIDEKDIQAAYNEAIGSQPAEQEFNASHILVETEEKAQELVEALKGGADFAETAQAESTGPSGPNGGSLGWFGAGAMVPEFDSVVTAMEVGTISDPVQTQFGWHVITLNETREKPKPTLAETRGQFENQIRQERVQARIAELRDAAEVEDLSAEVPASAIRDLSIFDQ